MNVNVGLTLGQVFTRAMHLFRQAGPVFLGIVLPLGLVSGLMVAGMTALQTRMATSGGVVILAFAGLVLIALLIAIIGYGALSHAALDLVAGRPTSVEGSWRQGIRFRVWGTWILSGIAIFLGTCCCLLPGVYLALAWGMAGPVVFEESIFHSKALSRSHQLTRFNPQGGLGNDPRFRIFLILAATLLTTYLLSTLVQLPLFVATIVYVAREATNGGTSGELPAWLQWLQVPTAVVGGWVQYVMTLLADLAVAVVYFDVRGRQEAKDLDLAIDNLGASPHA